MAIEEKTKLYEQAFLRAKKLKETCDSNAVVGWMEYIFPELKEIEDEKIRKDLINYLKSVLSNKKYGDKFIEDWIAWLEKQGEQKKELLQKLDDKLNNALENETPESLKKFLNDQKPVDKIQIGKKYKCIASPRYTTFMVGEIYKPEDRFLCSLMNFCSACFKPIEDDEQKPTDIKEYDFHGIKFIPKFAKGDIIKDKKCGEVLTIKDFSYDTGLYTHTYGQFPITIQDNYEIIAQKPAWSEEDEEIIEALISLCDEAQDNIPQLSALKNWLKNLKDRVQPQPKQEWSEKDEETLKCISCLLTEQSRPDYNGSTFWTKEQLVRWNNWLNARLKSLRPQNNVTVTDEELAQAKKDAYNDALDKIEYHSGEPTFDDGWSAAIWYLKKRNAQTQFTWKPSDEQIEALDFAADCIVPAEFCFKRRVLKELLEQLKKLK